MIDDELRRYINSLLKQGYGLHTIRKALIDAGHDIKKVENISLQAFTDTHKELLGYVQAEMNKGRNLDNICKDLLKLGHSDSTLREIIDFQKRSAPLRHLQRIKKAFRLENDFIGSLFRTFLPAFFVIVIVLGIITYSIAAFNPNVSSGYGKKPLICDDIAKLDGATGAYYSSLCRAMVENNDKLCQENTKSKSQDCLDSFNLYRSYKSRNTSFCDKIYNPDLKEFCHELKERSCSQYFGYGSHCTSIIGQKPSDCQAKETEKTTIIEDCQDNFYIYGAMAKDPALCKYVQKPSAKSLCMAMA